MELNYCSRCPASVTFIKIRADGSTAIMHISGFQERVAV